MSTPLSVKNPHLDSLSKIPEFTISHGKLVPTEPLDKQELTDHTNPFRSHVDTIEKILDSFVTLQDQKQPLLIPLAAETFALLKNELATLRAKALEEKRLLPDDAAKRRCFEVESEKTIERLLNQTSQAFSNMLDFLVHTHNIEAFSVAEEICTYMVQSLFENRIFCIKNLCEKFGKYSYSHWFSFMSFLKSRTDCEFLKPVWKEFSNLTLNKRAIPQHTLIEDFHQKYLDTIIAYAKSPKVATDLLAILGRPELNLTSYILSRCEHQSKFSLYKLKCTSTFCRDIVHAYLTNKKNVFLEKLLMDKYESIGRFTESTHSLSAIENFWKSAAQDLEALLITPDGNPHLLKTAMTVLKSFQTLSKIYFQLVNEGSTKDFTIPAELSGYHSLQKLLDLAIKTDPDSDFMKSCLKIEKKCIYFSKMLEKFSNLITMSGRLRIIALSGLVNFFVQNPHEDENFEKMFSCKEEDQLVIFECIMLSVPKNTIQELISWCKAEKPALSYIQKMNEIIPRHNLPHSLVQKPIFTTKPWEFNELGNPFDDTNNFFSMLRSNAPAKGTKTHIGAYLTIAKTQVEEDLIRFFMHEKPANRHYLQDYYELFSLYIKEQFRFFSLLLSSEFSSSVSSEEIKEFYARIFRIDMSLNGFKKDIMHLSIVSDLLEKFPFTETVQEKIMCAYTAYAAVLELSNAGLTVDYYLDYPSHMQEDFRSNFDRICSHYTANPSATMHKFYRALYSHITQERKKIAAQVQIILLPEKCKDFEVKFLRSSTLPNYQKNLSLLKLLHEEINRKSLTDEQAATLLQYNVDHLQSIYTKETFEHFFSSLRQFHQTVAKLSLSEECIDTLLNNMFSTLSFPAMDYFFNLPEKELLQVINLIWHNNIQDSSKPQYYETCIDSCAEPSSYLHLKTLRSLGIYCQNSPSADFHLFYKVLARYPNHFNFLTQCLSEEWFSFFDTIKTEGFEINYFIPMILSLYPKAPPPWLKEVKHDTSLLKLSIDLGKSLSDKGNISEKEKKLFERIILRLLHGPKASSIIPEDLHTLFPPNDFFTALSKENLLKLLSGVFPDYVPVQLFYHLENTGALPEYIETLPSLHRIPIEPLVRFLQTKTHTEAISWLQMTPPSGNQTRAKSLSVEQQAVLLSRFRRDDLPQPLPEWQKLFSDFPEDRLKSLIIKDPINSSEHEEFHARLQLDLDKNDPLSLFIPIIRELIVEESLDTSEELDMIDIFIHTVIALLYRAQEESLCGSRIVLTWGLNETGSCVCSTRDGIPITIRSGSTLTSLALKGVFNNLRESFPALELRRRLLPYFTNRSNPFVPEIQTAILNQDPALLWEITRVATRLASQYPTLKKYTTYIQRLCNEEEIDISPPSSDIDSESEDSACPESEESTHAEQIPEQPPIDKATDQISGPRTSVSSQTAIPSERVPRESLSPVPEEAPLEQSAAQLLVSSPDLIFENPDLLALLLKQCHENYSQIDAWATSFTFFNVFQSLHQHILRDEKLSSSYDQKNFSHEVAHLIIPLLFILRKSTLKEKEGRVEITINPHTQYHITHINPLRYTVQQKDNPWITSHLLTFCFDYPFQSQTPFTPNKNTRIEHICNLIKDIGAFQNDQFYRLCAKLFVQLRNFTDDLMLTSPYMEIVENTMKTNKLGLSGEALVSLHFLVDQYMPLLRKATGPLEPNKIYVQTDRIDQFVPQKKVPKFLQKYGSYASAICAHFTPIEPLSHDGNCGVEAVLIGLRNGRAYLSFNDPELSRDIANFRTQIVEYAKQNRNTLVKIFESEPDVDTLITEYAPTSITNTYTSDIALKCAAMLFQRPIYIYTTLSKIFHTDAESKVLPTQIFLPDGDQNKPPIRLIHFGKVHYAYLREGVSP